jgi:hypothetical protein
MKQLLLFVLLITFGFCLNAHSAGIEYFEKKGAVRYDFELVGGRSNVSLIKKDVKYLPEWGGNYSSLIAMPDYGIYRYRIFNVENDSLIFRKGFAPMFKEWQTTAEAKTDIRSYYQSLFFPRPKTDVVLKLDERTFEGRWKTIFIDTIRTNDIFIISEQYPLAPIDTIAYHGIPSQHVDLLILAEGYQSSEMEKFSLDARRLTDSLFAAEPFKTYQNSFNVLALQVPSVESGTDIPGGHCFRNTAFNSHFYTLGSPRYLSTSDMKSVYDAIDGIGWDHIYILVNDERYGGGGFYNFLSICSSDNALSPFVFCHEFGHGFAGLADEYYTSSTSYESFYNLDIEPWEPNITTMVGFNRKWFRLIEEGTPVPTLRSEKYAGKVGVFEGGGYEAKGIYSPVMSCWMKEKQAGGFCPACREAIEKTILLHCE